MIGAAAGHQRQQGPGGLRGRAFGEGAGGGVGVGFLVLAPAAVGALDGDEPVAGAGDGGIFRGDSGGVQGAEHGPGAINVIGAPAAEPGTVFFLVALQIGQGFLHDRVGGMHADLRQEGYAARGDVGGGWIEQRAVVGEGDVVQVELGVFRFECAPAAVAALHADDPGSGALDGVRVGGVAVAVQQHADDGGVVHVGVVGVVVLERPAAGLDIGAADSPVAFQVEDLAFGQPGAGGLHGFGGQRGAVGGFGHGVAGQAGIPDWRDAGLAIGFGAVIDEELAHREPGDGGFGRRGRVAQRVVHHDAVGHGGINGAETVLAV